MAQNATRFLVPCVLNVSLFGFFLGNDLRGVVVNSSIARGITNVISIDPVYYQTLTNHLHDDGC